MTVITKKVILIAAPEPPFTGTRLTVRVPSDQLTWGIANIALAGDLATVEWGDGSVEEIRTSEPLAHRYARPGVYEVRLSDNIASISVTGTNVPFADYAPLLMGFQSNGIALNRLLGSCLSGCRNLSAFDISNARVTIVNASVFANCASLSGTIRLPHLKKFNGSVDAQPFAGCTGGITEIHFPSEMEANITSRDFYQADPTLGTGTARCVFDE